MTRAEAHATTTEHQLGDAQQQHPSTFANGSPSEFLSSGLEMKIAPLLSRGHQHTGRPSLGNGEWLRMAKGRPGRNDARDKSRSLGFSPGANFSSPLKCLVFFKRWGRAGMPGLHFWLITDH